MAGSNPYSGLSSQVHTALDDLNADETHYTPQREAEELFLLPDCVHIFFVTADGKVSTFSEPSTLRIFKFKDSGEDPSFLQVGGWTHPLIPGQSPVLEAGNGAFMFPDVYEEDGKGASVGVVIADDSVFNLEGEAQAALAETLAQLTELKKSEKKEGSDTDSPTEEIKLGAIGSTMVKTAQLVTKGLEVGAEKATTLIEYAGEKQKAKSEAAASDVKVSPALKYTAVGAKYATKATVKVSGFVASRVGKLSKGMADYLAKKVEKPVVGATSGIGGGGSMKKSTTKENIVDAARGGIYAYATIYDGLEKSAKTIGQSLKAETVDVVKHQYGEEAGHVYHESMSAAGNAAMTYMNIQSLGVKGFLKKTAKTTGKNVGKAVIEAHSSSPTKTNAIEDKTQQ